MTLTTSDDVITAVEKIYKHQWNLQQRRAVKTKSPVTPSLRGFLLWPAAEPDSTWLIPQIIITVSRDALGKLDPANPNIDSAELLNQLKQIKAMPGAQVKWAVMPGLGGPIVVKNSD